MSEPRACKGLLALSGRVQDVQLFCSGMALPVPLAPGPLHTWDQPTQLSQRQPWAPGHTGRRCLSHIIISKEYFVGRSSGAQDTR